MSANVRFAEKLHKEQQKLSPDAVNVGVDIRDPAELNDVPLRAPNVMDEQFPTASLQAKEAKDRVMEAKLALQDPARPGYTNFGKLIAKDEDFEWAHRKEAAIEKANFQKWFAREFDMMSPAQKKRAKELYPQFYRERKQLLKKQAKNLFDYARIKLEGIESFKDLVRTYMAETGRLDLGPLQHLLNPEFDPDNNKENNQGKFRRGIANPWRAFGEEAYPANVATRQKQARVFETRKENAAWRMGTKLGVDHTGFPPFAGTDLNQGDRAWWQQLRMGAPN